MVLELNLTPDEMTRIFAKSFLKWCVINLDRKLSQLLKTIIVIKAKIQINSLLKRKWNIWIWNFHFPPENIIRQKNFHIFPFEKLEQKCLKIIEKCRPLSNFFSQKSTIKQFIRRNPWIIQESSQLMLTIDTFTNFCCRHHFCQKENSGKNAINPKKIAWKSIK